MDGLVGYDHGTGFHGPVASVDITSGDWGPAVAAIKPLSDVPEWTLAVVLSIEGTTAQIGIRPDNDVEGKLLPDRVTGTMSAADAKWAGKKFATLKPGDVVYVSPVAGKQGTFALEQIPEIEGALVAMDPRTGRVLAMVGGFSYSESEFNRATQALRQPGSAFKPVVYATALESGWTPASVVMDAPITLTGANGQAWTPENYEGKYYGPLQLRRGLELSRNTMTVRLAQGVGMNRISAMAEKLGVTDHMDKVLAMALGAGETTVFKLAGAYASFVNGGRKIEPHLIELVQDREGKTIFKADGRDCPRCDAGFNGDESPRIPEAGAQMMDPITAYQITSMLEGVVQRGTATQALVLGRPVGGKTGTTNDYRSAWFMGFSPKLVVGIFVGFDDNRSLGNGETGAVAAVPIFVSFMQEALKAEPADDFPAPKNAKYAMVRGIREAFRPGTEPKVAIAPEGGNAIGPIPYNQLPLNGVPGQPAQPAPPPKKPDDVTGLY
jgi:penicillin-binding protein 1A